ncbi:MAG: zinc-ribbon domain-containing protein [Candidatus Hodarchaeota archaeon]
MADVRDYNWAFPLAGGIIALIAFLTPAAYFITYSGSMYIWMWGLFSVNAYGYGSLTAFTQDPGEIFVSAVCSLMVIISIIVIIAKGYSAKKYRGESTWLAPSILLMIGTIAWIAGMEINGRLFYDFSLWLAVDPGFGVIGMFLGGILSIVGHGVSKMKPREAILPMKEQFMSPTISHPDTSVAVLGTSSFKFCPDCGEKIVQANQKFCVNCGFELKGVSEVIPKSQVIKPLTIPPDTEKTPLVKEDCPNCDLSRKLRRDECIWCGKTL